MTQGETPMWEDPQESSAMRQLLRAGQVENSDYDVDRGLARHLAQLQGGAPLPAWAVQSTLQKSASWSVLAWLLPPVISAGVVGAWLALRPADPAPASLIASAPKPTAAQVIAPTAAVAITSSAAAPARAEVSAASALDSAAEVPRQERDEVRDAHSLAVARSARPATRANSTRRGRAARADDLATNYGSAAQSNGIGSGGGSIVTKGTSDEGLSNQANQTTKVAAAKPAVNPAAQEPAPALVEEAQPKAERRAKEEESAKQDEVSGARLEREMRMLAVAQRVLTEDPARSLRLCRQGESEFRGSMFSAERKQVALLALVQLGKVDQARREGIPFLRAFPNAPWSARLREALSTGKLPNP